MRKTVYKSVLAAACLAALSAQAQTAAPASSLSYNIGAVSEYRYRGISQSRFSPAIQGGVDYTDKSGMYLGAWASQIRWIKDAGITNSSTTNVNGSTELDLYGGYKFKAGPGEWDFGVLRYQYVGNNLNQISTANYSNPNTTEVYGAGTFGVFTAKYSYSLGDLFGNINSKGSTYLDLSANLDLGTGLTLTPHVGKQDIKNNTTGSYTDYSVALAKEMSKGLVVSATAVSTNAKASFYSLGASGFGSANGKNLGKSTLVVGLKYSF